MAKILKGAPVVEALNKKTIEDVQTLAAKNIYPALAIVRVGERPDDVAYERGVTKRCEKTGVRVKLVTLPGDTAQEQLILKLNELNADASVHGILLFRPLPAGMDENKVRNTLSPEKDVDGITDMSLAGVFTETDTGFPPCTPQACMEILDYYGVDVKGKSAVVIGRSLVVGKPAAMMLTARHATVTICHTRTADIQSVCQNADILIVSAGRPRIVDKRYLSPNQVVIDVGINFDSGGNMCGDVDFEDAQAVAGAVTPVPGGVGTVTTAVLVKNVVMAAKKNTEV